MIDLEQKPADATLSKGGVVFGVHHIELWVGNALQSAHYFQNALGFTMAGFVGPATNCRDRVSYLMAQGALQVILTSGLDQESPITNWVRVHGDGVRDVALSVRSAEDAWCEAVRWGAQSIEDPHIEHRGTSQYGKAAVTAFGDTVHTLLSSNGISDSWFSNFRMIESSSKGASVVSALDHIAVAAECGQMEKLADFYEDVFGMTVTYQEDITTAHSGMRSKVLQSGNGSTRFTIVEPADGKRTSQVQEFIRFHAGPGVQHLALLTQDIFATAHAMKAAGVEFLSPPDQYYKLVSERLAESPFEVETLRRQGILLDRDEWGYLLQVFSKPVHCRPTLFIELIQREGARGFGRGNIRALFEALELEQTARGNL